MELLLHKTVTLTILLIICTRGMIYTLSLLMMMSNSQILFDFNPNSSTKSWYVVDDAVMGGRSSGKIKIDQLGNGVFYGEVSLENNGGFSSVRHQFKSLNLSEFSEVVFRVKGDKKNYQFRIKSNQSEGFSYIYPFETNGKWQEIRIPFSKMRPSFRGRYLAMDNFPGKQTEEVAFLIANKKTESFKLEIDKISFQ